MWEIATSTDTCRLLLCGMFPQRILCHCLTTAQLPYSCPYQPATVSAPFMAAKSKSESQSRYDWQSVSVSWCRAPCGSHDQMFVTVWRLLSCLCGGPLWWDVGSIVCHYVHKYLHFICLTYKVVYIQCMQGLCQSRLSTANCALLIVIRTTMQSRQLNGCTRVHLQI
jgi:hypothetical protein